MLNASAISMPNGSHHIEIINNTIHDSAAHAVSAHGGNDYITLRGNNIYNNTWYTSNGTHAVSFKGLNSFDTSDAAKIIVEGNSFHDNYNMLISWVTTKKFVTLAIDEAKNIHIQSALATPDPLTGTVWDHGRVLVANNLILRSGNAAITVNEGRGVDIVNNTIVDAGYVNQLIGQNNDPTSPLSGVFTVRNADGSTRQVSGFFSAQNLPPEFNVAAGGLRLSGIDDVRAINNLISISNPAQNAVDADSSVMNSTAVFANNIMTGGDGLRLRAITDDNPATDASALLAGFTSVASAGFVDAANGNYRLLAVSPAVNSGNATFADVFGITTDFLGVERIGVIDVGALEFIPLLTIPEPTTPTRDPSLELRAFTLMPGTAFTTRCSAAMGPMRCSAKTATTSCMARPAMTTSSAVPATI